MKCKLCGEDVDTHDAHRITLPMIGGNVLSSYRCLQCFCLHKSSGELVKSTIGEVAFSDSYGQNLNPVFWKKIEGELMIVPCQELDCDGIIGEDPDTFMTIYLTGVPGSSVYAHWCSKCRRLYYDGQALRDGDKKAFADEFCQFIDWRD